jgi:hypothetical protein
MNKEVFFLAGLPGSGKTTYLCQMCRDGWLVFDDFKAFAFEDCSKFCSSRKLNALLVAIRDGVRCAVADVDFRSACEANVRARNRSCVQRELDLIAKYSPSYNVPKGVVSLPVWQKL